MIGLRIKFVYPKQMSHNSCFITFNFTIVPYQFTRWHIYALSSYLFNFFPAHFPKSMISETQLLISTDIVTKQNVRYLDTIDPGMPPITAIVTIYNC